MTKFRVNDSYEYPVEKARRILEKDGIYLDEMELQQMVKFLTLIAIQDKKLMNQ